jgi:exodeoxyribonuclease V alpha subunit
MNTPQVLHGVVKILTFWNEENGYFVAKVSGPDGKTEQTVVGNSPVINVGMHIEAKGKWQPSNWGQQFKASEVLMTAPKDLAGIEKYLGSGAFFGIGPGAAKKLVAAFGTKVFSVIRDEPDKLNSVPGIGKKKAQSIIDGYREGEAKADIMVFLHQQGLSTSKADKIYKRYGEDTVKKVKKNPYLMTDEIWGMGFKTADAVAQQMGVALDSEYRIHSGILHIVREFVGKGSCGVPHDKLIENTSLLLGLTYEQIQAGIDRELATGALIKDIAAGEECYFARVVYAAEKNIAELLLKRKATPLDTIIDKVEGRLLHAEMEIGINLEETQKRAVLAALENNVCVITGGPGTGKTTITKTIVTILEDAGLNVMIVAPTGKASRRAAEQTGRDATTVHRALEIGKNGKFKRNKDNPLDCDVLVVDEMSMVDVSLFNNLLNALPDHCRLLLLGDVDQLPSVGAGKVLKDIIDSKAIPTVKLTEVFRQAKTSKIVMNAHTVNTGFAPESGWQAGADFGFLDNYLDCKADKTDEALVTLVRDMWKKGFDPIKDVQVLAPMKRGALGTLALNEKLRAVLNPNPAEKVEVGNLSFWLGDKVMQTKNNYDKDVFNGDIGIITSIIQKDKSVTVTFDERIVTYRFNELDELVLAYAITIHKSQGSEFPVVVMPLDTGHFVMLKRNLVYTGITRAKKLMVMIGSKKAAWMAVQDTQVAERYSRLKEWLVALPQIEIEDI